MIRLGKEQHELPVAGNEKSMIQSIKTEDIKGLQEAMKEVRRA